MTVQGPNGDAVASTRATCGLQPARETGHVQVGPNGSLLHVAKVLHRCVHGDRLSRARTSLCCAGAAAQH